MPKRYGKLWQPICDIENIKDATRTVLKRRKANGHWGQQEIDILNDFENFCDNIQRSLTNRNYEFGTVYSYRIKERRKWREIDHLDTAHAVYLQAVMNICQPIFIEKYIDTTYSSIKGRGLLPQMSKDIMRIIQRHPDYHYILADSKKCYENVNHAIAMQMIRTAFKDIYVLEFFEKLLALLPKGIAIGFNTSHYIVNLLFTRLDHRIKKLRNVYIIRFMDDIALFCPEELKVTVYKILQEEMDAIDQTIKPNLRFAPLTTDFHFCGLVYSLKGVRLNRDIVLSMKRKDRQLRKANVSDEYYKQQMASYWGWCKHTNSIPLWESILKDKCYLFKKQIEAMKRFSDFADPEDQEHETYTGQYWRKPDLLNKEVEFIAYREVCVRGKDKYIVRAFIDGVEGYFFTDAKAIKDRLKRYEAELPFVGKIVERTNKLGQLFMTII
ncbi:MAG: RNA-directed DNA polymerase [Paludibacteraceae bacterium]|nr:RNA-directed DNA polymerase [Paludibacteraceae bacterium]